MGFYGWKARPGALALAAETDTEDGEPDGAGRHPESHAIWEIDQPLLFGMPHRDIDLLIASNI